MSLEVTYKHEKWTALNASFPKEFPNKNRVTVYFGNEESEAKAAVIKDVNTVTGAIADYLKELGFRVRMDGKGELKAPGVEIDEIRQKDGGLSVVKISG